MTSQRPKVRSTTTRGKVDSPPAPQVLPADEEAVGTTVRELEAIYLLDKIRGFGPQKFKELHSLLITPEDLLSNPDRLPFKGKRAAAFRDSLRGFSHEDRAEVESRARRQIRAAADLGASVLTFNSPEYPPSVFASNNPVPILYVRGPLENLRGHKTVACVGSRDICSPYSERQEDFCRSANKLAFTIVSGFALGADTIGHTTALDESGRTICVMPGGLHQPFPPENRSLWEDLLKYSGATFVSEFAFGLQTSSLTLKKRNKLIVAFAAGTLVGQSSAKGGAMNAYRFSVEQKKAVCTFGADSSERTTGNARIMADPKAAATNFPSERPDFDGYEQWLSKLSCST